MTKHDVIVVGRWRNHHAIRDVVSQIRQAGKTVYCFIESEYDADGIKFETTEDADAESMIAATESLTDWQTNPTFQHIFETDMNALKDSDALVLVFPAGLSAHMELGAAYGMGKKCYGLGAPEKPETLYKMFDGLFQTTTELVRQFA